MDEGDIFRIKKCVVRVARVSLKATQSCLLKIEDTQGRVGVAV